MIGMGTIIQDKETRNQYRLNQHIDIGSYSCVYEAEIVDNTLYGQAKRVVVKIGRIREQDKINDDVLEARLKSLDERYKGEFEFIKQLRDKSGDRFAPHSHWATLVNQTGLDEIDKRVPILLMERIGNEWLLTNLKISETEQVNELTLVKAGVQYTQLLMVLHDQMGAACGDRKADDLRWTPEGKLFVLDWNVTEKLPGRTSESSDEEALRKKNEALSKVQRDIRIFGRLWFGLLVGWEPEKLKSLPIVDPPMSSPWASISQGTRRLLISTLESIDGKGFTCAEDTKRAWETWLNYLEQRDENILKEAKTLKDTEEAEGWKDRWDRASDLIDLVRSRGGDIDPVLFEELEEWLADKATVFENRLHLTQQSLRLGQYARSREDFDRFRHDEDWSSRQRLRASRWYLAASALKDWSEFGPTESLRPLMEEFVQALEQKDLKKAWDCVETIKDSVKDAQVQGILALQQDAVFQLGWKNASEITPNQVDQQLVSYKRLSDTLKSMREIDPLHAVLLRAWIEIPLESHIEELQETLLQLQKRKQAQAVEQQVANIIESKLRKAANVEPPYWPLLADGLAELPDDSELPDRLASLHRVLRVGVNAAALDIMQTTVTALTESSYVSLAEALRWLVGRLTVTKLSELAQRARWPDEVREGLELATAVNRLELTELQIQQVVRQLKEKDSLQKQLHEEFGDLPVIGDLDKSELDQALKKALEYRIEIFDRGGLTSEQAIQCSVAFLQAARRSAKLVKEVESFAYNLLELGTTLKKDPEQLLVNFEKINEVFAKYAELSKELKVKEVELNLEHFQEEIRGFDTIIKRLEYIRDRESESEELIRRASNLVSSLRIHLDMLSQTIRNAEYDIGQVPGKIDGVNRYLSLLQTANKRLEEVWDDGKEKAQEALALVQYAYKNIPFVWVIAGLQAVRTLNLADAESYLKKVEGFQSNSDQAVSILNLFRASKNWLLNLNQRPEIYQAFSAWRQSVIVGNPEQAETAYAKLTQHLKSHPDYAKELFSNWVGTELWGAYLTLLSTRKEPDSQQATVEELIKTWEQLNTSLLTQEVSLRQLNYSLQKTDQLLLSFPFYTVVPNYWYRLSAQLDQAYEGAIEWAGHHIERKESLICLGLIYFRTQRLVEASSNNSLETEEEFNRLLNDTSDQLLYEKSDDLKISLRKLVTYSDINSAELAARIVSQFYLKCLKHYKSEINSSEKLDAFKVVLESFKQMRYLNGAEQAELQNWIIWYETLQNIIMRINEWRNFNEQLELYNRSKSILECIDALYSPLKKTYPLLENVPDVPRVYWENLGQELGKAYNGLKNLLRRGQNGLNSNQRQWFLWLGKSYFDVQQIIHTLPTTLEQSPHPSDGSTPISHILIAQREEFRNEK